MLTTRRLFKLAPAIAIVALALPSSAFGQATRTWVSGVGDDANPCSRTAPCKTFAGAISKTAAKGEINCLDPGGFGGLTITKSITIKCHYTEGGVLVSGTNAMVVNAAATDSVTLRGLDINGLGTGLNGVRILSARSVKVLDSEIYGFVRDGVDHEPSNTNAKLQVIRTHIHDNTGNGVLVAPPAAGSSLAAVRNSDIDDNGCGATATNHLPDPGFVFTTNCGTQAAGAGGAAKLNIFRTGFADHNGTNGAGVFSNGQNTLVRIGENDITNNTFGIRAIDAGAAGIFSFQNNMIAGNGTNGAPNGTIGPLKKAKKGKK